MFNEDRLLAVTEKTWHEQDHVTRRIEPWYHPNGTVRLRRESEHVNDKQCAPSGHWHDDDACCKSKLFQDAVLWSRKYVYVEVRTTIDNALAPLARELLSEAAKGDVVTVYEPLCSWAHEWDRFVCSCGNETTSYSNQSGLEKNVSVSDLFAH